MTIEERIKAGIARHPERDNRLIAKAVRGATVAMVAAVRAGQPLPEPATPEAVVPCAGVISLDAIRARYDIAAAIRRELAKLKPGALITENEMRLRAAGKDASRFRRTWENNEEFRANRIKLKLDPDDGEGTWYWGDASTVAAALKLRDEI
jgi:hypothetical protein